MINTNSFHRYAPVVLRLGLSFVFIWFGLNQILDQREWISFIPDFLPTLTGMEAETLVIFNGVFETITGILLAFGVQIRIVAGLMFVHMIAIIAEVGLTAIGIRDVGLMFALLSVALHGADMHSYDAVYSPKRVSRSNPMIC